MQTFLVETYDTDTQSLGVVEMQATSIEALRESLLPNTEPGGPYHSFTIS